MENTETTTPDTETVNTETGEILTADATEDTPPFTREQLIERLRAVPGAKEWRKGDQHRFYMSPEVIGDLAGHKPSTSQKLSMGGVCFDIAARCWRAAGRHSTFQSKTYDAIERLTGFGWDATPTEWEEAKVNPMHGMTADARMALAKLPEATTAQLVALVSGLNLDIAEEVIKRRDAKQPEVIEAALRSESATVRTWTEAMNGTELPSEHVRRAITDPDVYDTRWFLQALLGATETPAELREHAAAALKDLEQED